MTCLNYAAEINPFPSLSKTLKAYINYYYVSVSFIFLYDIMVTLPLMIRIMENLWYHYHRHRLN